MASDNDLRNGIIQALVGESSSATLNNSKLLEVDIVRSVTGPSGLFLYCARRD
ncbi:hypothetical protein FOYG_15047 [Fusarium oxysporum NRRL 32931]|uniref:Uncharacterized protein n=1 Tax=Fusarium oxysporum NRRL 32931 TaxID=660029 RepID=W9HL30_FUSOX|nr:hypothetical protein FOYG_15047 [Fusarium oxysporum NRRL 32931]